MIYIGITIWFFIYLLDNEKDMCRTNYENSLTYKLLPTNFYLNHIGWFTQNLWKQEYYEKDRLFKLPLPVEWEWFLVKNVLTFLNDYWKFCKFFKMMLVCYLLAYFTGYIWLMLPFFAIGGGLHSLIDGSLFRK